MPCRQSGIGGAYITSLKEQFVEDATANVSMRNWYNERQQILLPQLRDGK